MTFQCIGSDAYCKAMAETAQLGLLVAFATVAVLAMVMIVAWALRK